MKNRMGEACLRPKRTATKVAGMALLVCALLLTAGAALAFDPPRMIGELYGTPDSIGYGDQFCWVGDQNGDQIDDLIISHDLNYQPDHVNAIKIYFGDNRLNNYQTTLFQGTSSVVPGTICFGGRLDSVNDKWIVIQAFVMDNDRIVRSQLSLFKGFNELDSIPDFVMTTPIDSYYVVSNQSYGNRPADFNGDGYKDILTAIKGEVEDRSAYLSIFFGSEDFDTIPDWNVAYPPPRWDHSFGWSAGYDINNDGCDDFILKDHSNIEIYLGGDPMDSLTYLRVSSDIFEPRRLVEFAMLPDVNGDGYDDWGFYYVGSDGRVDYDGYYLFYGSDEPDFEPDVTLAGNHLISSFLGQITGGDYNNDGYGDIITTNPAAYFGEGELHVHFGGEDIRRDPDIRISIAETYGEQYTGLGTLLGANGDYNGDGFQDFISSYNSSFVGGVLYHRLCILTSGENWVSVPKENIEIRPQEFFISRVNITLTALHEAITGSKSSMCHAGLSGS